MGRRRAARVRRVPARVVAEPPDLRAHARAARAGRAPPGLGRELAQLHARCSSSRCPDEAIDALLAASSRACRTSSRAQIRDRADGIPLYAVETVRMLLDRGLLERDGDEYRPSGPIDGARRPRDAPGADRRPARRARPGGAPAARGRLRARQDVLARAASPRCPASTRRRSSRCSAGSSARRCSCSRPTRARPSAASTASSRRSSSGSPTRRSRGAIARRGTCAAAEYLRARPGSIRTRSRR